jgi:hypothetical protein
LSPIPFFGFGLDPAEVEAQLNERHLMVVRGVRTDRRRKAMSTDDCHDLHVFAPSRLPYAISAALGRPEGRIDEALGCVEFAFAAKRIRQVDEIGGPRASGSAADPAASAGCSLPESASGSAPTEHLKVEPSR